MRLQTLVSAMHQADYSLLEKMNIQSDAIVINQCDYNSFDEFEYNGYNIKWYSLNERGVGLSRNTALMRADADILLFADEDIIYTDGYAQRILNFFEDNPRVEMATFNIKSLNPDRPEHYDYKSHRLHCINCLKYGACKIAVRRKAINASGISFSLLFGGGAKHQAGEDNLFMTNCIRSGLHVIASNILIGDVEQSESTWFKGYNEKYYYDRGALFKAMYGRRAKLMLVLFEAKHIFTKSELSFTQRLKHEFEGANCFGKI